MKKILFSCMLACNAMAMSPSSLESQPLIQNQRAPLCRIGRFFADIAGATLGVASGATIAYFTSLNGFLSAAFTIGGASAGAALSDFIFRGCTDHTVTSHQSENDKRKKRSEAFESLNALSPDSRNQVMLYFEENRNSLTPVPFPNLSSDDESVSKTEPVLSPNLSSDDESVSKIEPVQPPNLSSIEAEELRAAFTPPSSPSSTARTIVAQMSPNTQRAVLRELQQSETGTPSYTPKVEFTSDSDEEDDPESIAKKITPENAEKVFNCLTPTKLAHMTRSLPPSSPQNRDKMYLQNGDWVQGKYQSDGSVLDGSGHTTITKRSNYEGRLINNSPHGIGRIEISSVTINGIWILGQLSFSENTSISVNVGTTQQEFTGFGDLKINIIDLAKRYGLSRITLYPQEDGYEAVAYITNEEGNYGVYISNSIVWVGETKDMQLNGQGQRWTKDGNYAEGIFENGQFQKNQNIRGTFTETRYVGPDGKQYASKEAYERLSVGNE